ncbi:MAG: hypothetical protein NC819_00435 [Candidatus Omnitrophica bacterium]|nr:hypothetical protein [Candidatus Omnitrophota bacterium]
MRKSSVCAAAFFLLASGLSGSGFAAEEDQAASPAASGMKADAGQKGGKRWSIRGKIVELKRQRQEALEAGDQERAEKLAEQIQRLREKVQQSSAGMRRKFKQGKTPIGLWSREKVPPQPDFEDEPVGGIGGAKAKAGEARERAESGPKWFGGPGSGSAAGFRSLDVGEIDDLFLEGWPEIDTVQPPAAQETEKSDK